MKKPFSARSTQSGSDTLGERLHPWCIIRPFPNMRSKIVGRFRRRIGALMSSASAQANDTNGSF